MPVVNRVRACASCCGVQNSKGTDMIWCAGSKRVTIFCCWGKSSWSKSRFSLWNCLLDNIFFANIFFVCFVKYHLAMIWVCHSMSWVENPPPRIPVTTGMTRNWLDYHLTSHVNGISVFGAIVFGWRILQQGTKLMLYEAKAFPSQKV